MRKMKVIALVAAIIAGLALYKFLDIISQPQEIPTTPVVVAAVNIPENTEITAEMLQIQPIPTQAVLDNAVLDMDQAIGLIMSSDVLAGEQIVFGRLVKMGEQDSKSNTLAYVVEPGMRAMTISVGFTSGMATMVKPGNRVDVVMNYTKLAPAQEGAPADQDKGTPATRILIQDAQVLAVDATMGKQGVTMDVGYSTVTLMVTPEQAVQLSYGQTNGSLHLILRSQLDSGKVNVPVITADTMQR